MMQSTKVSLLGHRMGWTWVERGSRGANGEEQRETLEKAEGLRFQVEEDPLAQVAEGIKLTKQRVH